MARRVAMGKLADGTFGLRISKSGFDANANPPVPQNLILDSSWPALLPIHQTGSFTFGTNGASVSFPRLPFLPVCGLFLRQVGRDGSVAWSYPNLPSDGSIITTGNASGDALQVYVGQSSVSTTYQQGNGSVNAATWILHYVIYKIGAR